MCDTASARIGITATASKTAASIPLYRMNAIISPFQERNLKASPNAKVKAHRQHHKSKGNRQNDHPLGKEIASLAHRDDPQLFQDITALLIIYQHRCQNAQDGRQNQKKY